MAISTYSYQLRQTVTLLNDREWAVVEPLALNRIERIRKYRELHGCDLKEALEKENLGHAALDKYEELSGVRLSHPDEIWFVKMSLYGALCPECRRPFRTPKAKLCADCGYELPEGAVAGPLTE